ncbi:permease prefix domain 1-containing protein [Gracilibacillus xinjiangensis]|uniref:Permease prefix domain 1-containing protein n=1 Tax=Gracilibacillus xinjiangensis TaxID=1193282 RepID=A0ABV8WS56_9BACI
MNTIISYLDNMFASLPKSAQMSQLRDELLANMEEKYHELKQMGKTENEAIGIVISEFGNIDEIIEEFGVSTAEDAETQLLLTEAEVDKYLHTTRKSSKWIGVGAVLCIVGASVLVLIIGLMENGLLGGIDDETGIFIGLITMLLFVAIAVGLFIYAGMKLEEFKYISLRDNFDLSIQLKNKLESEQSTYQPNYMLAMIIGVVLIILSPAVLFAVLAFNEQFVNFGVFIMLLLVSIAVYLFVYSGNVYNSYNKILKNQAPKAVASEDHEEDRIISAVAVIVWPLAVIIFLISGLIYGQWHINWIVFPITGLLFAIFSGAYSILVRKNE